MDASDVLGGCGTLCHCDYGLTFVGIRILTELNI